MSSSYSSLLSQGNPVAADTEATPAPQAPASEGKYSSLLNPSPAANSYSSLINQPKPQENPESSVVPVSPAPITSGSYSSLLGSQAPSEKYSDSPVLTNDEVDYAKKSPDEMEDEPWYSKAWEWANSPLYDLHQWGTRTGAGAFEKGLETGLEDIGSGFTSPLQIGLTLATFGGDAVEEAGISLLRGIGVSKVAAPVVASTAKLLMTAGFSAQMIGGLVTQSPQFLDALKDGDIENATRLGTNIAASGIFLREGLKHGYEDAASVKNYIKGKTMTTTDRLAAIKELDGVLQESIQKGSDSARARAQEIMEQLKAAGVGSDEIRQAGIRHYMTQEGTHEEKIESIRKMLGISEGTIQPRELTPEEKVLEDKAVELRNWAKDSSSITKISKDPEAAPATFYMADSAKGTHKLGQTFTTEGTDDQAHYIQMKNPKHMSTEESLNKFIEQSGGEAQAKKLLQDAGHDGITYQDAEGNLKYVTFGEDQYRPKAEYKEVHDAAWSRDHVYIAVDKKNLPKILNQGIGLDPKRNNVTYHPTPSTALDKATLPDSGNKSDLVVLSVPRAEVEKGVYETNAAVHAQTSDRAAIGPVEVLPRANRSLPVGDNRVPPAGSGKMQDKAGEVQPPAPGFEKHLEMSGQFKKKNAITSDREIHAHEMAHSIWAMLGKLPIGDILSHLHGDAKQGEGFVGAAKIGLENYMAPINGEWRFIPKKLNSTNMISLVDSMMAGTVADEMVSGIKPEDNQGDSSDHERVRELLASKGISRIDDQNDIIEASKNKIRKQMKQFGIDAIIKQEFAKGREPGLPNEINYTSDRMLKIGDRVKDAINGLTKRSTEVANSPGVQGNLQGESVSGAGEGNPRGAPLALRDKTERPPIGDEDLVTEKRHMAGHVLEMEPFKDKNGQDSVRATGRSTPVRPLGAEELPSDNTRFKNSYTPAEAEKYRDGLRAGMNLNEGEIAIAKTLRQLYDNSFQKAYERGQTRSWVEAYHPQAWANVHGSFWHKLFNNDTEDVTNGALNDLRHDTQSGRFDTNVNSAKHRAYNTEFQGVMAGEKFKTADLTTHVYNHLNALEHAQANRDFLNNIRKKDARGADGRPLVVLKGTARKFGGDENPALAINPERTQKIHIDPEKVKAMMDPHPQTGVNELQEGLKNGTIEKLPFTTEDENGQKMAAYAYTAEGYETLDHPATRAWGYAGQDTAGNPALMEGRMHFHPDIANYAREVLGIADSPVRNNKILGGINTVAGEGKGLLLSFSPFHIIQEGLRAMLVGINPTKFDHIDINDNPSLQRGVRKGLVRNNYKAEDEFSTGQASHSKLIGALPGLSRIQGKMQSFLFDKYIPGLKDRAYLKLYDDILAKNTKLLPDEAAERAASMTNDVFGGQNWRKLGVTTAQQDFARMSLLAPDWLVSEVRMGMRAAGLMDKETGAISRKQMAIQMASLWGAARVLNMLATGQMHNEAPFGVATKDKDGKESVYSIRALPTDLLHAMSDPRGFVAGRVNPLTVRPAGEFLSGRDEQGRRVTGAGQVTDLIRNTLPISVQGVVKGSSLSPLQQVAKGVGASVTRYKTEAEKLADQYASDHMPTGPVNPENLAAHQRQVALEDQLRQGQISIGQLKGKISARRADEIIKERNMTPLQVRFDRLPLSEALNVWAAATPSEKDLLHTQLWKKRVAWLKLHSGAERVNEPVWRKLQSTFADLR